MNIEVFKIYITIFIIGIILYSIGSFKNIDIDNGLYKSKIIKIKIIGLITFILAFSGLVINIYIDLINYKPGLIALSLGVGLLIGLSLITILITIQYIIIDLLKTKVIDFDNLMIKSIDKKGNSDNFCKIKKIEIYQSRWTGYANPIDFLGYIVIIDENKNRHVITNASINIDKFSNRFKGINKKRIKKWIQLIEKKNYGQHYSKGKPNF